jgi:cell division protein FtsB
LPESVRRSPSPRTARRRAIVGVLLVGALLVAVLFTFVYPTRSWLDQRGELGQARVKLSLLHVESAKLAAESKRLQSDAEIERIARQSYGLLKPGERGFVVLPAPTTEPSPSTVPSAATRAP